MNACIVLCLVALAVTAQARPSDEDHYTDRFDNINLDEILPNHRLLEPYLKCMLELITRCTPDAKELKSHIREALENNCAKCTEKQQKGTRKVIGHLINHEKDYWAQLTAKYDPQHKYVTKYETELRTVTA